MSRRSRGGQRRQAHARSHCSRNPSATRAAEWREHAGPARHDQRRQGDAGTREVPVPRQQPVDERHLQRVARRIVQRRGRRTHTIRPSSATAPIIPPCSSARIVVRRPIEFLLHGLAACITAGIGNIAAARGVTLTSVESQVEGDIDLQGILGLSDKVRNGYERIRISFTIAGDAPPEKLREIVEQSRARSAVFDVLTNGVPVDVSVNTR